MQLNELRPTPGARKKKKRLGRGNASGRGGTSTKGHKGQNARSGASRRRGFEGGQMPLARRLPKRGFNNPCGRQFAVVNVDQLAGWPSDKPVTEAELIEGGIVSKRLDGIKLLGRGECPAKLTICLTRVSASARQKVEAAGGKIETTGKS